MFRVWNLLKLVSLSCLFLSCQEKGDLTILETLVAMNNPVFEGEPVSKEAVDDIRKVLDQYRKEIETRIHLQEELGILYRKLAMKYLEIDGIGQTIVDRLSQEESVFSPDSTRESALFHQALALGYFDKKIYRMAYISLDKAIEIFPENELNFYYAGICAARIAVAEVLPDGQEEKNTWLQKSESLYRQAIKLAPNYTDALYGLSILLVYEMNRPVEAEPLLKKILDRETRNTNVLFLLASVFYMTDRYEEAIEQYETIERITKIEEIKEQARENKEKVLGELFESQQ